MITKIKSFIDKYNYQRINHPSEKNNWRKIWKNVLKIVLSKFLLINCLHSM